MRILFGLLFVSIAFGGVSPDLKKALSEFEAKEFEPARRSAEAILLAGRGEELEAALYLLVKINLATDQAERAAKGADRLLHAFPTGDYREYARFARAESAFLLNDLNGAREDLQWCADSAGDNRLADRARGILEERSEFDHEEYLFPQSRSAALRESMGSEHRAHVKLLLSFPDPTDPAADQLEQAFKFAAEQLNLYDVDVVRPGSAYAAVQELDRTVGEDYDLIVFAGDEGSATSIALANGAHDFPILKLTSTARSLAALSNGLVEFLPSQETQGAAAARYAANDLAIGHGLMLTPLNDIGQAQKDGFHRCSDFGLTLDSEKEYPANASNVKPELYDLFTTPQRLDRGGEVVEALLSRNEREKLLERNAQGDVSVPSLPETNVGSEVLFFSLDNERIANYCSQLGRIPAGMTLFGNSSWIDQRALESQSMVTRGMYMVTPLLPFADRETELFLAMDEQEDFDLTPWELLGLDAADFVSAALIRQVDSGADFVEAAREVGHFSGAAVEVEIAATGENRLSRILQFTGDELKVIK